MRRQVFFLFALLGGIFCQAQEPGIVLPLSQYGLPVVNDPEIYKKIVRMNPEDELLDMRLLVPDAQFDVTYATTNNDHHRALYETPDVFMRKPAALALVKVNEAMKKLGYGLVLYDGYRPYAVTVIFYERHPDTTFVADPRKGSRHNRGMAIDISLYDLKSGKRLPMPSAYDESSERAYHSYTGGKKVALTNREILKKAMVEAGFNVYLWEWWHYDFNGWEKCYTYDLRHPQVRKANEEMEKERAGGQ